MHLTVLTTMATMALFPKRQLALISAATTRAIGGRATACAGGDGAAAAAFVSSRNQRNFNYGQHCSIKNSRGMQSLPSLFQTTTTTTTIKTKPASATFSARGARRLFSSADNNNSNENNKIALPNKTGDRNGLIRHEIISDDGHPLRLYSRAPRRNDDNDNTPSSAPDGTDRQRTILLLHGRTWSSQPVFDLRTSDDDAKQQSTLQSLADLGFRAYALDFRGFGETPRDYDASGGGGTGIGGGGGGGGGGYTTPRRCVADVKCAVDWIAERHNQTADGGVANTDDAHGYPNMEDPTVISTKPALLGWSQGALVAQMYAQQHGPATLSDLILFGSIFDPKVIYPRKPLYDPSGKLISGLSNDVARPPAPEIQNTDIASLEDFTLPGTICDEAALTFSSLALAVDSTKAAWDDLHEFNMCNPALIHVPTMVMVGAQDPYVSWEAQRELFERLGTEDRAMCVLPGCDHAAHILKARKMFVRGVTGFLMRKDGF